MAACIYSCTGCYLTNLANLSHRAFHQCFNTTSLLSRSLCGSLCARIRFSLVERKSFIHESAHNKAFGLSLGHNYVRSGFVERDIAVEFLGGFSSCFQHHKINASRQYYNQCLQTGLLASKQLRRINSTRNMYFCVQQIDTSPYWCLVFKLASLHLLCTVLIFGTGTRLLQFLSNQM